MPMGIVSEKDFNSELGKVGIDNPNPPTTKIVDIERPGRKEGDVNVPDALRRVIGETAISNGRESALEMARQFGLSPSSVSAYTQGATSTSSYNERPNADVIVKSKNQIGKLAIGKLRRALHKITDDKLEGTTAKDLAGIAKDMSAIVKNMDSDTSKNPNENGKSGPTFVFYSPQFRREEHFDVVAAKE